jgi:glycosyltransferase involved in cell wall biosynthesis
LNIAIDARMISRSGIGRYTQNLVKNLAKIDRDNTYSVLVNNKEEALEERENLEFFPLRREIPIYGLSEQVLLPLEVRRRKPDLVHYPNFNMPLVNPAPVVVTIHDLIYYLFPDACPGRAAHLYARFMFRAVPRLAKRIITDSEYTKNDIVRHLGIKPEKISVVHLAIDPIYRPVEDARRLEAARKKYGITGEYVFYAGTHQPRKNLVRLVKAFSRLKTKDHLLVITGKKEERRREVYDTVERLGLSERVVFTGMVPEEDLPELYSMADLFVFPSLYEGFGLPPLEAMACGTPVVTSEATSLPEVVGDAALIADPLDVDSIALCMERVLSNASFAGELREKGFSRVKRFSWLKTAEKTLDVYNEVLGDGRGGNSR